MSVLKPQSRTQTSIPQPNFAERDACGIFALVKKDGKASHGNVKRALEGLTRMAHRTGEINGEGDGAGIQTDIPRAMWARRLVKAGLRPTVVEDPYFTVLHLMIPHDLRNQAADIKSRVLDLLREADLEIVLEQTAQVRTEALGPLARKSEPEFWQIALVPRSWRPIEDRDTFEIQLRIERTLPVYVISFSHNTAVYKVRGDAGTLRRYFSELRHPDFKSAIALTHCRYSTNTNSTAERAQMFSTLGHNGEINTISKLIREATALGIQFPVGASDSQALDRILEALMFTHGLSLMEAMEILFPPVWSEIERLPSDLESLYTRYRRCFGSFAQGPAALIARQGDEIVFSCDAMGLRPLWFGETEKEFFASSEKGVVPIENLSGDPKPLAPGERMGMLVSRGKGVEVFAHHELRLRLLESTSSSSIRPKKWIAPDLSLLRAEDIDFVSSGATRKRYQPAEWRALLNFGGWSQDEVNDIEAMAASGKESITGLGYDGPLAALSNIKRNLSDYFHEQVAVVTNPAIDGVREAEHFSTRVRLGARPWLDSVDDEHEQLTLETPLLLGGAGCLSLTRQQSLAVEVGTLCIEEVLSLKLAMGVAAAAHASTSTASLPESGALSVTQLSLGYSPDSTMTKALSELIVRAEEAVRYEAATLIVLDDALAIENGQPLIDPYLAVAAIDNHFTQTFIDGQSLLRQCSLILKSQQLRTVHDIAFALGMGADAVNPYRLFEVAIASAATEEEQLARLRNCVNTLHSGLEKVISTMGIHELDGYGRLFSSIGLANDLASHFGVKNHCGGSAGLSLADLDRESKLRAYELKDSNTSSLSRDHRSGPNLWRLIGRVGRLEADYKEYSERFGAIENKIPTALRHLMEIREDPQAAIATGNVDLSIKGYNAPLYIAAMSFGSQGLTSFRAYAEAAKQLNIICINGEGGEPEETFGRYYRNRGQQVASARFGVNAAMLNSCGLIEIKIGQGAKPGEGGLLPGYKVTAKIAHTRRTPEKIDLISPSNNHDIYSIEDLAQLIEELKTVNPRAMVSVKIPSIAHLGPIANGIAKAGADIIAISGYEGGTGAARKHSTRHVGLPVEIGLAEAHHALLESGLRSRVELWSDGGMRTAEDALKMILLGADRVGFASAAMNAIGCTVCRECHAGTCHVGITSQIQSAQDAHQRGLKHFIPREFEDATRHLVNFFGSVFADMQRLIAQSGCDNVRSLVGRTDLLYQARSTDKCDLTELLDQPQAVATSASHPDAERVRRSRTVLTKSVADSVIEKLNAGLSRVIYDDDAVTNIDRSLGTYLSGKLVRKRANNPTMKSAGTTLRFYDGVTPGNGLGAFNVDGVDIFVEGGVQDGVAKCADGGSITILKGLNHDGLRVDGSVGKCFAYGAQSGTFIVQGDADSRAGIRLSGADVIIGGRLQTPLHDELGSISARANIKGFAFEYQTSGRGLVLGDPGPWLCSGMTGGVVYFLLDEALGLNLEALRRRLARNSQVTIAPVGEIDRQNLSELLTIYIDALTAGGHREEADAIVILLKNWATCFAVARPKS